MTIPSYSAYSSSKRALLGFSFAARAELEKDRIVVSEIYPFIAATNFGKNSMGNPVAADLHLGNSAATSYSLSVLIKAASAAGCWRRLG